MEKDSSRELWRSLPGGLHALMVKVETGLSFQTVIAASSICFPL
jgi:hypothetical protein